MKAKQLKVKLYATAVNKEHHSTLRARGARPRAARGRRGADRALVYLYENTSGFGMNSFTASQLMTDVSSLIIGLYRIRPYLLYPNKPSTGENGKG